ncbi:MAG: hypothetical protein P4M15_02585 [Alphaproteobacteria bacterium]|nr:hypothetical protein [Alphaproteobacteria bacterium]
MRRVAAFLALFVFAACGEDVPVYSHSTYALPTAPGGRLCVAQCRDAQQYCAQSCTLDYRACYNDMQRQAIKAYDRYTSDRFARGLNVVLTPSDFEHPEACDRDKRACLADCERPYNACYTSCGGTVSTQTSCRFLCFE